MTKIDAPTDHTKRLHAEACCDPTFDWEDRRDFDFASRGLIHRPSDEAILDAHGDAVWHHKAFEDFLHGDAPETVHPSLWRHALLDNHRGLFKVTDGVYQVRGTSIANITFLETNRGYVVIDALNTAEVARYSLDLLYRHVGKKPVKAIIYSHSHSDHFGGVKGLVSDEDVGRGRVNIIASDSFLEWVLKEQGLAAEGMASRTSYMYGDNLPIGPHGLVDDGLGQAAERGQVTFIAPTDIIGTGGGKFRVDGLDLEFMYAPGEAPTGMHVYAPAYKTLHVADNCYMCMHNIYTIRGAFPRDAMQWADSVARSQVFGAAEFLVSGHNWPVFGREEVLRFLGQQRDGIKYMHDQTLRLMSHGYVPSEIANQISFPPSLARLWHLRGYYGSLKHNVRGIYDYYLGWYDGNPANLDALPPREYAAKLIEYMGGVETVLSKARRDIEEGEYRWGVQILDQVLWAYPGQGEAKALAADAHAQLGYQSENATWRNAYLSAAIELREGLPTRANARVAWDVVKGMPLAMLLNALSIRLNGPKASSQSFSINWQLSDGDEACSSHLSNAVLVNRDGPSEVVDVTLRLPRRLLNEIVLGRPEMASLEKGGLTMSGDSTVLPRLLDMLDQFPDWFPIATHGLKFGESDA